MSSNYDWQSVQWDDGSLYEGEFDNNRMQGYGVYIWNDGSLYRGEWHGGMMHGCGAKIWRGPDGDVNSLEGKFFFDDYIGPIGLCTEETARTAATEADVAATLARAFSTPAGKERRLMGKDARASQKAGRVDSNSNQRFAPPAFQLFPNQAPRTGPMSTPSTSTPSTSFPPGSRTSNYSTPSAPERTTGAPPFPSFPWGSNNSAPSAPERRTGAPPFPSFPWSSNNSTPSAPEQTTGAPTFQSFPWGALFGFGSKKQEPTATLPFDMAKGGSTFPPGLGSQAAADSDVYEKTRRLTELERGMVGKVVQQLAGLGSLQTLPELRRSRTKEA
eukprot:gene22703-29859_t